MNETRSLALGSVFLVAMSCKLPEVPTYDGGTPSDGRAAEDLGTGDGGVPWIDATDAPASRDARACEATGDAPARASCDAAACPPMQWVDRGDGGFWIETRVITVERFRGVGDSGYRPPDDACASAGGRIDAAMDCVSLHDAERFCALEGHGGGVPTFEELEASAALECVEADRLMNWEWTSGADGGSARRWPWADAALSSPTIPYQGARFRCVVRP